ncbi:hypothetical protein [Nonomuraea sp. NPDC003754]
MYNLLVRVGVLAADGLPTFRVDTGELSPQAVVCAVTGHISALLSRNQGVIADHKVHDHEAAVSGIRRRGREEIGVHLDPVSLRPATVVHHLSPEGKPRVGIFCATSSWAGKVFNAEAAKCVGLRWEPTHSLPDNTVPYTSAGIGLYGWPELASAG